MRKRRAHQKSALPAIDRLVKKSPAKFIRRAASQLGSLPSFHFHRIQVIGCHPENGGETKKLLVSYAPQPRFDLRQSPPADVQAGQLAAGRQFFLREAGFVAQLFDLWPNDVGRCFGASHARFRA